MATTPVTSILEMSGLATVLHLIVTTLNDVVSWTLEEPIFFPYIFFLKLSQLLYSAQIKPKQQLFTSAFSRRQHNE